MSGAVFTTITGDAWKRALGSARVRRVEEAAKYGVENVSCENSACARRHECARYMAAEKPMRASWPGGRECVAFTPRDVRKEAAA